MIVLTNFFAVSKEEVMTKAANAAVQLLTLTNNNGQPRDVVMQGLNADEYQVHDIDMML